MSHRGFGLDFMPASDVITSYTHFVKIPLRRIGNSLGVILPKATLQARKVGEGDELELSEQGLRPPKLAASRHVGVSFR